MKHIQWLQTYLKKEVHCENGVLIVTSRVRKTQQKTNQKV